MTGSDITPRERFHALDALERARWLDPAEAEFCAHGFENASLNRILKQAGLSKGRSYHYFADKGELFRATLDRRMAGIAELCDEAVLAAKEPGLFWQEVAALGARLTAALQKDESLAALIRTLHQERAAQQACAVQLDVFRARVEALLTAGQAIGAVRGDLPISLLVAVTLQLIVTVDHWFADHAAALDMAQEQLLSRQAFGLLIAPLIPPSQFGDDLP